MGFRAAVLAGLVAAGVVLPGSPASARLVRYDLLSGSTITQMCRSCGQPPAPSEALSGSFELATLPIPGASEVAAVTEMAWHANSFDITGSGFLQRTGGAARLVLETRINGDPVLLTNSGRRQQVDPAVLTIVLSSPREGPTGYLLVLLARPAGARQPDSDGDTITDEVDNCPADPNFDQHDTDRDAVGDPCDACAETATDEHVTSNGCSLSQLCPCEGPNAGEEWQDQRAYVRCVGRALRALRRAGRLSRREVVDLIRGAVRSGCGRTIIALR